jgi:uncharacterized membrane protein YbjE (DUF340 family)
MWILALTLGLGAVVGWFGIVPKKFMPWVGRFMTGGIMVLLFLMGAQLGMNEDLVSSLGTMGLQAFIITVASIIGSIVAVKLVEKKIMLLEAENKKNLAAGEGE